MNVEPWPRRLSARRRPWWASTMSRQTARPRPVPPWPEASGQVLVEKNGSKIRRRSPGAMPIPCRSRSARQGGRWRQAVSLRFTAPPSGIAWRALISRLSRTCWIWAGLTRANGRP